MKKFEDIVSTIVITKHIYDDEHAVFWRAKTTEVPSATFTGVGETPEEAVLDLRKDIEGHFNKKERNMAAYYEADGTLLIP